MQHTSMNSVSCRVEKDVTWMGSVFVSSLTRGIEEPDRKEKKQIPEWEAAKPKQYSQN